MTGARWADAAPTGIGIAPDSWAAPASPLRAAAVPALLAVGAVGAIGVLRVLSPYVAGTYPACPTYAFTGMYCPGCGALRALHDLGHLDVVAAWGMNPLAVLAVPLIAALWLGWLRRRVTGRPRTWLAPPWVLKGLLILVVLFTVGRNIPALAPWLAPG
jgi:hypothetical protein